MPPNANRIEARGNSAILVHLVLTCHRQIAQVHLAYNQHVIALRIGLHFAAGIGRSGGEVHSPAGEATLTRRKTTILLDASGSMVVRGMVQTHHCHGRGDAKSPLLQADQTDLELLRNR